MINLTTPLGGRSLRVGQVPPQRHQHHQELLQLQRRRHCRLPQQRGAGQPGGQTRHAVPSPTGRYGNHMLYIRDLWFRWLVFLYLICTVFVFTLKMYSSVHIFTVYSPFFVTDIVYTSNIMYSLFYNFFLCSCVYIFTVYNTILFPRSSRARSSASSSLSASWRSTRGSRASASWSSRDSIKRPETEYSSQIYRNSQRHSMWVEKSR